MTKISMQTVNCPACGKEASFRVYESINAGLDPELKKKLYTEESPLIFTCPHCGKKSFVSYDFLYHDMDRRYMIWFVPSGKIPKSPVDEATDSADDKLAEMMMKFTEGYRYRYVRDVDELLEKIMELDSDYPDFAWEILKVLLCTSLNEELSHKDLKVEHFRFQDMDEEKITCVFFVSGEATGIEVGIEMLKGIADGFEYVEGDDYVRVDDEWASKFLRASDGEGNSY